eukprot:4885005-Pleurochrysis_carterae.AAC.1
MPERSLYVSTSVDTFRLRHRLSQTSQELCADAEQCAQCTRTILLCCCVLSLRFTHLHRQSFLQHCATP